MYASTEGGPGVAVLISPVDAELPDTGLVYVDDRCIEPVWKTRLFSRTAPTSAHAS